MIFDTTHNTKQVNRSLDLLTGKAFRLLERIKLGGIGSNKMQIETSSERLKVYLNPSHYPTFANVEIRSKGIIIHINKGLKSYAWAIPYFSLVIYHTESLTIHSRGEFLRFKNPDSIHLEFVKKVLNEKSKWSSNMTYIT